MDGKDENLYEFGGFRLDARERTLRQGGKIVPLQPKTIDVLCVLVARAGEVVTKSELMGSVWRDSFVEESNLTQSIYTLRRTLGNGEDASRLIETLARRGYRFAAPVKKVPRATESPPAKTAGFFRSRKFALICAVALLVLVPAGIYTAYRFSARRSPAAPVENMTLQRLTFSGKTSFPVIAPDGRSFMFAGDDGIFVQDVDSGGSVRLDVTGHKIFGNLQYSPDGEHIFFRDEVRPDRGGNIFRISSLGGTAQRIADNVWSTPGFSPDGKRMAFVRFFPARSEFNLVVRDLASGGENIILTRHQPQNLLRLTFPAWSQDAQKLLVVEQSPGEKNASRLLVVDIASGITQGVDTPPFVQIEQPVWHPVTGDIYVAGREQNRFFQLWRISYPGGEIKRITNDLNIYRYISISADGRTMLARQGSSYSHLWTAPAADLENQTQLTTGNLNRDGSDGIAWTASGDLVYASRITGALDIWSIRGADGTRRQLTDKAGTNENPFVTTDGKYIYFDSTRSGSRHIWRMGINGEDPVQVTDGEKERDLWPVASPDGAWLYYLQRSPAANLVRRRSLLEGLSDAITDPGKVSPENSLTISPDGRYLAFGVTLAKEPGGEDARTIRFGIVPAGAPGEVRFLDLAASIAKIFWAPDSMAVDYVEDTPGGARVWRLGLEEGARPRLLFTAPKDQIFDLAWSADGKTLAMARGRQVNDAILLKNFE